MKRSQFAKSYYAHQKETNQTDSPLLLLIFETRRNLKQVPFKERTFKDSQESFKSGYASSFGRRYF